MKIVFISNYMSHHQQPLSDVLWRKTNGKYVFVETGTMSSERRELGYSPIRRNYVLQLHGNEALVLQKIREADVVMAGSAPETLLRERIRCGKLLLRYAERPLKNGAEPLKYLPRLLRWHWRNPPGKPIYLLCASAYTAGDYAKFILFRNRTFRWGYFPEQKTYDLLQLFDSKSYTEILWCGRFLKYKHPEQALAAAIRLKKEGHRFCLKFIGRGEREAQLQSMVKENGLEDCVQLLGSMPPEEVRKAMEKAGIFLLTSDREEGWGAVLNEAMNSGCAVIASHAAGSVPFLVKDGKNGLIYHSKDAEMLYEKTKYLLEHPQEQKRLGTAAYETIRDIWNPEIAADRLLALAQELLEGETNQELFVDGPCSRAEAIKENWFP